MRVEIQGLGQASEESHVGILQSQVGQRSAVTPATGNL